MVSSDITPYCASSRTICFFSCANFRSDHLDVDLFHILYLFFIQLFDLRVFEEHDQQQVVFCDLAQERELPLQAGYRLRNW